MSIAILLIVSD